MSISLTIGTNAPLSIDGVTDLENLASATGLQLGKEFSNDLNTRLSALPNDFQATNVSYSSGNQSWTPAGPVTFTLSGGVSGKITIIKSGNLLSYTDGFPTTVTLELDPTTNSNSTVNVPVPADSVYLCLELDFDISGGITGSYISGAFGLTANASGGASTSVAFYRRCDPSMTLLAAVEDAFKGFVLPMHANTLNHLRVGDYLHYTFNGNLQLGLGASAGFDKVFYAGLYRAQVPDAAGVLAANLSVKPEVQAGAKLSFGYTYAGAFEILLWKELTTPAQIGLHLYRAQNQDISLGLNLGVTVTTGASACAAVTTTQVTSTLTQSIPAPLQSAFTNAVLTPASGEVQKFVDEANAKVTSWLAPLNGQKSSLDLAVDRSVDRFLLTNYTIDTTQNYAAAWSEMLSGRFVDAFEIPGSGVSLASGSGLEAIYKTTTSIKLNLFGKLSAEWDTSTISNSSLLYAGNQTFHLLTTEGKEMLRLMNGSSREIQIYFAAEAALSAAQAISPEINLHVVLQASNDASYGSYIATIVGMLTSGPTGQALKSSVHALAQQANTTQVLHFIFKQGAYAQLNSSTIRNGQPDSEATDMSNFNAFRNACSQLFPDNPANFVFSGVPLDYNLWRNTNIAQNDQWPASPSALPNRLETGPYSAADNYLRSIFPGAGNATMLIYYMFEVASQFMNLCEALKNLCHLAVETNLGNWEALIQLLKGIVKNDLDKDFIAPTALALNQLCGGAPTAVTGPAPGLPSGRSIGITMRY